MKNEEIMMIEIKEIIMMKDMITDKSTTNLIEEKTISQKNIAKFQHHKKKRCKFLKKILMQRM